jgi:hypothetical protein
MELHTIGIETHDQRIDAGHSKMTVIANRASGYYR